MTRFTLLTALLLALTIAALAGDYRTDHPSSAATPAYHDRSAYGRFSSAERNLIRAGLLEAERRATAKQPQTGLPPGLEKKRAPDKALPPGWQEKLAPGEHLEQSFYSRGRALPDELLRQLPPAPPGTEILRIEDQVLRLDAATRTIFDVFSLGGDR